MSSLSMAAAGQAAIDEILATKSPITTRSVPVGDLLRERDASGFVGLLASTMSATPAAPLHTRHDTGSIVPPPELARFGNGRIPLEELLPVGNGSARLHAPAAHAFRRMAAAAWRSGVDLKVLDGYRSLRDQNDVARELGTFPEGGTAAVPGTSTHGWGLSVDVDVEGGAGEWLRANAVHYGFAEDVPGEPWHWTYRPAW